jgi:hypothetical protein
MSNMKATKITIELVVLGDPAEALSVVESLLDNGTPQDEISDWEGSGDPMRCAAATILHEPEDVTDEYVNQNADFEEGLAEDRAGA